MFESCALHVLKESTLNSLSSGSIPCQFRCAFYYLVFCVLIVLAFEVSDIPSSLLRTLSEFSNPPRASVAPILAKFYTAPLRGRMPHSISLELDRYAPRIRVQISPA